VGIARRGFVFILASPSGAGKTTLSRLLHKGDIGVKLGVSATTRPRRPSEVDSVDYFFVSEDEFGALRDEAKLLEWAEVHGYLYGTPVTVVSEYINAGEDVVLEIDWQGTIQLQQKMPGDVVSVLLLPPSMSELERRLRRRAEDNEGVIKDRLGNARGDIVEWRRFDYVMVNRELHQTYSELECILRAERLRRERNVGLDVFISDLLGQ